LAQRRFLGDVFFGVLGGVFKKLPDEPSAA
jgi:hypothetical protein